MSRWRDTRRWPSIKPAFGGCIVLAGICVHATWECMCVTSCFEIVFRAKPTISNKGIIVYLDRNNLNMLHNVTKIALFTNLNPYPAKINNLYFHPLLVVSRYSDPQLQVTENYSYFFNFSTNISKSCCLDTHFIHNNSDFVD